MKREFRNRFNELLKIKETNTAKIGRGRDFETLINDIFEDEGILLKQSYQTSDNKSEQIDGAIELLNRIILFEVKWVESGIASSELFAFIGKVENKLDGTLGLFISKEELSDNFIQAITKGRKRNVLLLHGEDISILFKGRFSLKEYFEYCIRRYSYDNIIHCPVSTFIDEKNKADELRKSKPVFSTSNTNSIEKILEIIFSDNKVEEHKIDIKIDKLSFDEKGQLALYLLEKYPKYYDAYISSLFSKRNRNQFGNIKYTLSEAISQKDVTDHIFKKYYEVYSVSMNEMYLSDFLWESFKKYYDKLKDKDRFNSALYNNFKEIVGSYDKENMLTRVIRDIWDFIGKELQEKFLYEYLDIFVSSRSAGYEQKEFARALINKKEYNDTLKKWIKSKIKEETELEVLSVEDLDNEVKYFSRHYNDMMYALDFDETAWHKFIRKEYKVYLGSR